MILRVTLEVVPFGDEDRVYEIGRLDIFNKGADHFGHWRYGVIEITPKEGGLYDKDVLHRRHYGAWELVRKAIADLEIKGPE